MKHRGEFPGQYLCEAPCTIWPPFCIYLRYHVSSDRHAEHGCVDHVMQTGEFVVCAQATNSSGEAAYQLCAECVKPQCTVCPPVFVCHPHHAGHGSRNRPPCSQHNHTRTEHDEHVILERESVQECVRVGCMDPNDQEFVRRNMMTMFRV